MPFDHFDLIAGFYDRAAQFTPSDMLLDLLAPSPACRLLDAGGGTGRVAAGLRNLVGEAVVADLSSGMLRRAADKGLASVCVPLENLPFPPGAFDRIVMMDALHHVHDQRQTAAELWRVLAPRGRLVIVEPDIRHFAVKLIALGEKLLLMRSHFLDGDRIAALFEDRTARVSVTTDEFNVFVLVEKVR